MDEGFFRELAARIEAGPVVVASVTATRGATPRKAGARMLVAANSSAFSIGGGMAEVRVLSAARSLLNASSGAREIVVDLSGGPGAAGICGGEMRIALRRWSGEDLGTARRIADALAQGNDQVLDTLHLGGGDVPQWLRPDPRLLVVGGGHCAQALCELAAPLAFERWAFDERPEVFDAGGFDGVRCLGGDYARLTEAFATRRAVFAVLLNRDFMSDVATLRAMAACAPVHLAMMGSRRRIASVREALGVLPEGLAGLQAPVGLEIEAETPHEIAVSILAELIAARARWRQGLESAAGDEPSQR